MKIEKVTLGWQPDYSFGTWHPCGRRLLGPVRFEQRLDGSPTGLFFMVSRPRYWTIRALAATCRISVVGCVARHLLQKMRVLYQWTWLHNGPRGES